MAQAAAAAHIPFVNPVDLVVRAVEGGWLIDCPMLGQPLAFFSGGKVQDRTQTVIGASRYSAGHPAPSAGGGIRVPEAVHIA